MIDVQTNSGYSFVGGATSNDTYVSSEHIQSYQTGGGKKRRSSRKKLKRNRTKRIKKNKSLSKRRKSRKPRKSKKGGDAHDVPKKKKRKAPAHAALQTEVIKMIVAKDSINYPQAMKKLKEYVAKALGHPYEKGGEITYIDALKKTKAMLSK